MHKMEKCNFIIGEIVDQSILDHFELYPIDSLIGSQLDSLS